MAVSISLLPLQASAAYTEYGGDVWGLVASGPMSARECAALAYDSGRNRTVLYGGVSGSNLSDTWEWDGNAWSEAAPTVAPGPLYCESMAYDAAEQASVLFGGMEPSGYWSAETFAWNGSNWQHLTPAASPPGRDSAAMVYDSTRNKIVMFGGRGGAGPLNDTWEWDGSTWKQVATAHAPAPRHGAQTVFDSAVGRTILFGGQGGPNDSDFYQDTWTYDGTDWTQISTNGAPPARSSGAADFDSKQALTVLFGGYAGSSPPLADMWTFDSSSNTWTQIPLSMWQWLGYRALASMAYDTADGVSILFGGFDGYSYSNQTWVSPAVPAATASPASVDFGTVAPHALNQTRTLTVSDSGTGNLNLGSASVQGTGASQFSVSSDGCSGVILRPGDACALSLNFAATSLGLSEARLVFPTNTTSGMLAVPLTGDVVGPIVTAPTQIEFGSQRVSTTSAPQQVSITNSGNADLHISAVGLQENGSSDFVLNPTSPCSGLTVPAGGTCGFTVTFAPQALYQRSASIAISDDAYNSPQHVNLLGTGTDAIGLANPSSVDFGTVNGGASSFVATVTVSNSGNDVLHVASVTVSDPADFAVSADYCSGMAINPNSTCTVGVFFQPQTFGSFTSTLTVNDDAFNGPSQVSLRGTGVAGHPSFNPANVAFGAVKVNHLSSLQPVVATNVGNASLHVGTLSIQGQNSRDFFIAQDSCSGTTLAPGTSCTVQLVFRPTAQGTRSAYVLFADDDPLGAATIALSGTGSKA